MGNIKVALPSLLTALSTRACSQNFSLVLSAPSAPRVSESATWKWERGPLPSHRHSLTYVHQVSHQPWLSHPAKPSRDGHTAELCKWLLDKWRNEWPGRPIRVHVNGDKSGMVVF